MAMMDNLGKSDPKLADIIIKEGKRVRSSLELIPSENFASKAVLQALGNFFNCKYSEGYPKKRYYGGNEFVDDVELLVD